MLMGLVLIGGAGCTLYFSSDRLGGFAAGVLFVVGLLISLVALDVRP